MTKLPLVSVIIPLYNAEKYIIGAIQSVLAQTYPSIEILVIDDGSTDDSLVITKTFERDKVKVFSQPNKGASAARNFGFHQSKGDFIKFFDADDLMNPEMIASQIALAINNEDSIISGKWGRFYNNDISTFKLSTEECWQTMNPIDWICSSWKNGGSMTQSGIFLLPKKIIEKAGLWDETLSLIDDLEYFTKTILKSKKVVFCNHSTLYYRSGISNSLSGRRSRKSIESFFKSIDLSVNYLVSYNKNYDSLLSAANVWQSFIFDCYPKHLDLIKKAETKVISLTRPTLPYTNNKYKKIIIHIIGWKLFKRFQNIKKIKCELNFCITLF